MSVRSRAAFAALSLSMLLPTAGAAEEPATPRAVFDTVPSPNPMTMNVAVVLDARTGRTLGRVPIGVGQTDVSFSPDGSRAVLFGEAFDAPSTALEVRTSDFAPIRSVRADTLGDVTADVPAAFYGGDGVLYAVIRRPDEASSASRYTVVRVGAEGQAPLFETSGVDFVMSADRRVGFVVDVSNGARGAGDNEMTLEVVDLVRFTTRSKYAVPDLDGVGLVAPNADGSEIALLVDSAHVRFLDAATGAVRREMATGLEADWYMMNESAGGHALLLSISGDGDQAPSPQTVWLTARGAVLAPAMSVGLDTGSTRYTVEPSGRKLFVDDGGNRPTRTVKLRAVTRDDDASGRLPAALHVTPDGARLILILEGAADDC